VKFNHVVIETEQHADFDRVVGVRIDDEPFKHVAAVEVIDSASDVTRVTITLLASRVDRERITHVAAAAQTPEAYEAERQHAMRKPEADDGHADGTD
jgi:hypothetical protein